MLQSKYVLESEKKFIDIDEAELDKRKDIQQCVNLINKGVVLGKNKGKRLLKEQQIVLQKWLEELMIDGKVKSSATIKNNIWAIFALSIGVRKPYSQMTNDDLKRYIFETKQRLSDNTLASKMMCMKKFFKWLYGLKDEKYIEKGVYPSIVTWMKSRTNETNVMDENSLLTHEEIKAMGQAGDSRDACFINVIYEGALRLGECLGIKLKDIIWNDDDTVNIVVNGKTGKRKLPFIDSVPFIKSWLKEHPFRNEPNANLICNMGNQVGRAMKKMGGWSIIKKLARRTQINKKVYTHLLRHSRLNYLAKYYKFNERDLRKFAGWSGTSNMPNVYLHYDMDVVEDKIRGVKGKTENTLEKKRLQQEQVLRNIKCEKCRAVNPCTAVICYKCDKPLEIKRKEIANEEMNELFKDEEFKQLVKGYLKKKALE